MKKCRWCEQAYSSGRPAHFASDPRCAFDESGEFMSDNWQCAGLDGIREESERVHLWNDDQHCAVLRCGKDFMVVSYYKNRGGTDGLWVVEDDRMRVATLTDVEIFESTRCARMQEGA